MEDIVPAGTGRRKHERESRQSRSLAAQSVQHVKSQAFAVSGGLEIKTAASMEINARCQDRPLPRKNSRTDTGELPRNCPDAEATGQSTATSHEPQLILSGTSISHSTVNTEFQKHSGELKPVSLPVASISNPRSSTPPSLFGLAAPPSSSTRVPPSIAFPAHMAVCRAPVEAAKRETTSADRINSRGKGTFLEEKNKSLYEKQALSQESSDLADPPAALLQYSSNEDHANKSGGGLRIYEGRDHHAPSWSNEQKPPSSKKCRRNSERTCEDLPEVYESEGGLEGTHHGALVRDAENAVLPGGTAIIDRQSAYAVQIKTEGSTRGIQWDKAEIRLDNNSAGEHDVVARPLHGEQRSGLSSRQHTKQRILTIPNVINSPLPCGIPTSQHSSAYCAPSMSAVCRPMSGGVPGAPAGACEEMSRPVSEASKQPEDNDTYLQSNPKYDTVEARLTNVDAEQCRKDNAEAAGRSTESGKSQGNQSHGKINFEPKFKSAHVTESDASSSRCTLDKATTTTESSCTISETTAKTLHSTLSLRRNGTLPADDNKFALPLCAEGVEIVNEHTHDANKGNTNDQGLAIVPTLPPHLRIKEGRTCLPTHVQRKHSTEGLSRSESSTAAGSYCEASEPGLYSALSIAESESTIDSAATLKDFCGSYGERDTKVSVVASEATLLENRRAGQKAQTQGSASPQSSAPRDTWERGVDELTEKTHSSLRCNQGNSAPSSSPRQIVDVSADHQELRQSARGHAGGELPRPVTLQQQQQQQELLRQQLHQQLRRQHAAGHNPLERYDCPQHLGREELQQEQLQQRQVRQHQQLEQLELPKQQLNQQHLHQQPEHEHLRQHLLQEQHLWQRVHEQQRQQSRLREQDTRIQEKLLLKHEHQHLEQRQRQQHESEGHAQPAFSVSGRVGQHGRSYAAAASPSEALAQPAADDTSLSQATSLSKLRNRREGPSAGAEALMTLVRGLRAGSRKTGNFSSSSKNASEECALATEPEGGNSVSQVEYDENSQLYTKNGAEESVETRLKSLPWGRIPCAASVKKTSQGSIQDDDLASRGRESKTVQEKKDRRISNVVAIEFPTGRISVANSSAAEEFRQGESHGDVGSSSAGRNDELHAIPSEDALLEKCCEDVWYHHGAKCYVVSASHTGERKLFLFFEKDYGKELAQSLAIACHKNRLTPEQLALGVPLTHVKDASVYRSNEGVEPCPFPSTGENELTLQGPGAGGRAATGAPKGREREVANQRKHETESNTPETKMSHSQYQHHTTQYERQQQYRKDRELRQRETSLQHQELQHQHQGLQQQDGEQPPQQQREDFRQQQRNQLRRPHQELRQSQFTVQQPHPEAVQQSQEEPRQHGVKEEATDLPREAHLPQEKRALPQMQQGQLRQQDHLVQQQQYLCKQEDEFPQRRQQQHGAYLQQRLNRQPEISAAQEQVEWVAAGLLRAKNQRAVQRMKASAPGVEQHSSDKDEQQEFPRTKEPQQQPQETSSLSATGGASASSYQTRAKEEDSAAATSIATRMPRKRTLSRRAAAADTEKGSTATRKRSRNVGRSGAQMQEEGKAIAEAYKTGNREIFSAGGKIFAAAKSAVAASCSGVHRVKPRSVAEANATAAVTCAAAIAAPHGVWFNSHTKSWTCATVGPRRQLLVFSSARYGFEAARALAVEARIRSVQALQKQQQQQLQQQDQEQKQDSGEQQHLHRQQRQVINSQQHHLQAQQLYGHQQGKPVGIENTTEQQQQHGELDTYQQRPAPGQSDTVPHDNRKRNAQRSGGLLNNGSSNAVQGQGCLYEQCLSAETEKVTANKGKGVIAPPEAAMLRDKSRDTVENSVGELREGRRSSYRSTHEAEDRNNSKWSSCGSSSSNSSTSGLTEKEEQLLYAGKAAISLVLSDLLEVCLPQLWMLSAHIQNDLRACIESAVWRVHAAAHPTQLQPYFNLFGPCFLRAKAPSSLPLNHRIHYFEALSGLHLPVYAEEQQHATVHAAATDMAEETKNAAAAN